MKSKKIIALLLSACTFSTVFSAMPVSAKEQEKKNYIVLLSEPELLSDERTWLMSDDEDARNEIRAELIKNQDKIKDEINSFSRASLFSDDEEYKSLSFTDVLNGFTVKVTEEEAEKIRFTDGVKTVIEDEVMTMSEPEDSGSITAEEETAQLSEAGNAAVSNTYSKINSGNLIGADKMYEKGYDGTGRVVAVIDTEIDYNNDFFSLSDPSKAKYTKADIDRIINEKNVNVKGNQLEANLVYRSQKIPFAYNYTDDETVSDKVSVHGSHVSGIVAGNTATVNDGSENSGRVRGIAPEAQLLFFRVADKKGQLPSSSILAAIDDAVKFEVDSINISIGANGLSENHEISAITGQVLKNAEKAGTSVVYAAGNSSRAFNSVDKPDTNTADNSSFPASLAVGSVHNTYTYSEYLEDENGNIYYCDTRGKSGKDAVFGLTDIVNCGSGSVEELSNAKGKAAVISLPEPMELKISLQTAFQNAAKAGVAAVIVINSYNQVTNGNMGISIPAFYMPKKVGEQLLENASQIKYDAVSRIINTYDKPYRSYYSSYAFSDNLDITVDFAAPGGNIYSSLPYNEMGNMSGTSMAAPQVTGAMALMYEFAEKNYSSLFANSKVGFIKNLLSSSADTLYEENGAISSCRVVGSGLINMDKATQTNVILTDVNSDVSRINLKDNMSSEFTVSFNVTNISSDKTVTFDGAGVEISTDGYKHYDSLNQNGFDGIKEIKCTAGGFDTVSIEPYQTKTVTMTINLDNEDVEELKNVMTNGFFVDGKITLTSSGETNCPVGIPFSGFYGDWNSMSIADKNKLGSELYFNVNEQGYDISITPKNTDEGVAVYISENPDSMFLDKDVLVYEALERNAYLKVNFGDIKSSNTKFINKFYTEPFSAGMTVRDMAQLAKNSDTIHIDMTLPYYKESQNPKTQTLDIKVMKDSEKPQISVNTYEQNGKTMARVKVSDNINVAAMYCSGYNSSGTNVRNVQTVNAKSREFILDITGLRNVDYTVVDSAFNTDGVYGKVTMSEENGILTVRNDTASGVKGILMIGVYDDNGALKELNAVSEKDCSILPNDKIERNISEYTDKKYKVFFWESINSLIPVCASYENKLLN